MIFRKMIAFSRIQRIDSQRYEILTSICQKSLLRLPRGFFGRYLGLTPKSRERTGKIKE
jgi:hypothetical protein